MTTRHFPIVIEQDQDGVYLIECPSFVGCRSYGANLNEALANIKEAIELCIEEASDETEDTVFVGVRDLEIAI
jgi:predicted RNase H-like HicB family nuclease